jgi:hypothetical protein
MQRSTITRKYTLIPTCKLPYNDFFPKRLASGFTQSAAKIVSPNEKTDLDSDTMWYNSEDVTCHIGEIG